MRVFITGGAGFIGSALTHRLASDGATVRIYDSLLAQVHGSNPQIDLPADLVRGDVRDAGAMAVALREFEPEVIVHLAAETGTGQSADEPVRYTSVNVVGTANLIEIVRTLSKPPQRIVLAATRAVYGEGAYRNSSGQRLIPEPRRSADMAAGRFDIYDRDGARLTPIPTPEDSAPAPGSVYGSSKLMQEYLLQQAPLPCPLVILRLQNVYGPGQSLNNPYTGVLSIFCRQAMDGLSLNIYEDGEIYRDFVYILDVVDAFAAACTHPNAPGNLVNIGTGQATSIRAAAEIILKKLGMSGSDRSYVSGMFRPGDVRYAVADVSRAAEFLGWKARVSFEEGLGHLVDWASRSV